MTVFNFVVINDCCFLFILTDLRSVCQQYDLRRSLRTVHRIYIYIHALYFIIFRLCRRQPLLRLSSRLYIVYLFIQSL